MSTNGLYTAKCRQSIFIIVNCGIVYLSNPAGRLTIIVAARFFYKVGRMDEDKRVIDQDLLNYLDNMKTELKQSQKESEQHIKESFTLTINPIKDTTERHTKDIDDLYNKDREHRDRFGEIEGRVKTLEDDKDDSKHGKEIRVGIWAVAVTIVLGVGAWIISLFK